MCTYARTVYACNHETWGRLIKPCSVQANVPSEHDCCNKREPHAMHSRKVPRKCADCVALDDKFADVKTRLDECRAFFDERITNRVGKVKVDAEKTLAHKDKQVENRRDLYIIVEEA